MDAAAAENTRIKPSREFSVRFHSRSVRFLSVGVVSRLYKRTRVNFERSINILRFFPFVAIFLPFSVRLDLFPFGSSKISDVQRWKILQTLFNSAKLVQARGTNNLYNWISYSRNSRSYDRHSDSNKCIRTSNSSFNWALIEIWFE